MANNENGRRILNELFLDVQKTGDDIRVYTRNGVQIVGAIKDFDEQVIALNAKNSGVCRRMKYIFIDAISTVELE